MAPNILLYSQKLRLLYELIILQRNETQLKCMVGIGRKRYHSQTIPCFASYRAI